MFQIKMPKIIFRYGTMNSSKTANLLMVAYNYQVQNKAIFLIKPSCDTRDSENKIFSRAFKEGVSCNLIITPEIDDINPYLPKDINIACILVDECQFLSSININALRTINQNVPIICYGLRTDFTTKLFPGSMRLFEIADTIEEIKTVCVNCNHKAIINSKFTIKENGTKEILYSGNQFDLGGEEKYEPVCWNCWVRNY
jgi:thymidine kinase